MPFSTIMLIVGGVVMMDLIIVSALMHHGVDSFFNSLARTYPNRPVMTTSLRKDFQSMRSGMFNFGLCVHIAVDEQHLHLLPALLPRLYGAKATSVPWEHISVKERKKRTALVRMGPIEFEIPAWVMEAGSVDALSLDARSINGASTDQAH
jgi:hypothetical protein